MIHNGFPINLRDDVTKIMKLISQKTYNNNTIGESQDIVEYFQDDNVIKFPNRIYYIDNSDEYIDSLNEQQKMIVHCIYSRSCDGFVRQNHLNRLLLMDYKDWAIPYIVKICDEYVVEILEMTYQILKEQDTKLIKKFCLQNNVSFCKAIIEWLAIGTNITDIKTKVFNNILAENYLEIVLDTQNQWNVGKTEICETIHFNYQGLDYKKSLKQFFLV